jgi:hypothetical protein
MNFTTWRNGEISEKRKFLKKIVEKKGGLMPSFFNRIPDAFRS